MLYRFSICRKGLPPCRFKPVSGDVALDGCGAAPGQLQGSTACFRIIAGLVSYRPELQLRKLDTLRGCRFGELGLTEKPASRHEHANKPQPNKSEAATNPRQNTHHSHTARVLSCSFKLAAPIHPGAQSAQNQNPSSAKPLPSKPARLQVWWARVCRHSQDTQGSRPIQTPAHHMCSPRQQRISASFARSSPQLETPCPTLSPTRMSGGPPRQQ